LGHLEGVFDDDDDDVVTVCVMLCYVMLCYVMLCVFMCSTTQSIRLEEQRCTQSGFASLPRVDPSASPDQA
jgi:hypothetical protein